MWASQPASLRQSTLGLVFPFGFFLNSLESHGETWGLGVLFADPTAERAGWRLIKVLGITPVGSVISWISPGYSVYVLLMYLHGRIK